MSELLRPQSRYILPEFRERTTNGERIHNPYTKRMFQERVAFHTGQTQEQIEADSDRDRWFTAQEAKDYGFIDQVITGATQVPEGAGTLN